MSLFWEPLHPMVNLQCSQELRMFLCTSTPSVYRVRLRTVTSPTPALWTSCPAQTRSIPISSSTERLRVAVHANSRDHPNLATSWEFGTAHSKSAWIILCCVLYDGVPGVLFPKFLLEDKVSVTQPVLGGSGLNSYQGSHITRPGTFVHGAIFLSPWLVQAWWVILTITCSWLLFPRGSEAIGEEGLHACAWASSCPTVTLLAMNKIEGRQCQWVCRDLQLDGTALVPGVGVLGWAEM
ncbi:frizzled-3 [Lates japonicus]|uniref:Frizzled-3 n=1 Tax=Lates japonicus TaxID=270547 RepID=A0AAD3MUL3_LATJO|nr:frizzled-3 [Lates japonicus]